MLVFLHLLCLVLNKIIQCVLGRGLLYRFLLINFFFFRSPCPFLCNFLIPSNSRARKIRIVSKRCIPFNWSQEEFDLLTDYIQMPDLITAIDNIKILANIQGVGICSYLFVLYIFIHDTSSSSKVHFIFKKIH